MALSRVKTWIAGEVLTAADLNAEFNNILNNPISLISPLTGALDVDGYTITLDAAAATTVSSSASRSWEFTSGAKAGTPATTGSIANWSAQTFTDSATAGSGTATSWVGFAIQRPTLAATNASVTTTDAATLYIPNSPLAGTNETITNAHAIWVDDGNVRFDGNLTVGGYISTTHGPTYMNNVGLTASVAANALTIALKTKALADPSTSSPVVVSIRNYTDTSGSYDTHSVTAALSITVPNGATLGIAGAGTAYISVYLVNENGTIRIGVYQSQTTLAAEYAQSSLSAIGTGSDSATSLYVNAASGATGTTRLIGFVVVDANAGAWGSAPTIVYVGDRLYRTISL